LAAAQAARPLGAALALATQRHQLVAGLHVPRKMADEIKSHIPDGLHGESFPAALAQGLKPILDVESVALQADFGESTGVKGQLVFPDDDKAKEALWPVKDGIGLLRLVLGPLSAQVAHEADTAAIVPLMKEAELALRTVTVEQKGAELEVSLRAKTDLAAVATTGRAVAEAVVKVRQAAERMRSQNNLKQIALAMHNYHDTFGTFPANAIYSKDGKPLLSWRVAILPFIEQDALYRQFHLDEPWDSPHNKELLKQMPPVYAPVQGKKAEPYTTFYQGFVGDGAFFEGKEGIRIADITDGTSNTILVVEAGESVPWSKPADLPFAANNPVPKLGAFYPNGFNAAFCDGSVHFLSRTIEEAVLRALITRNGGEVIDFNKLEK
jgi:prepilin-type processing-associated H-X9-DG protein